MPGKVASRAQQAYLAIHKPKVLKELAGGAKLPKNLPDHVAPKVTEVHVMRGQKTIRVR